ncbi:MAG: hypothetical protein GDA36_10135 [Rhodobacteraceae bacterium]|nr:hypothetical protein [Paracoccaceae bacterium]
MIFWSRGCCALQDRAKADAPDDPPAPATIPVPTRKRDGSGMPGYEDDTHRLCPPGQGPGEESFIDKVRTGTCQPGRAPRV